MAQTSYGTITITDTTDIESIVVEYAQNQDPLTAPTNGWGSTRPEWAEGYYIWQRTRTHKYGTSSSDDNIGVAVCITGSQGETGRSLTSTTTQYTTAASSATITTDNMGDYIWYTNIPSYNSSTPVYWVRVTNIYSNPSTGYLDVYSGEVADGSGSSNGSGSSGQNNLENNITTVYIIYKDEGLTSAVSMSQTALTTSQNALTQASSNINTIIRLWYRSNSATAPNKPTSHVTQSSNNVDNTWTTTKPIDKDGYRYYYYCDELCTGGGVYKWTDVVLDTSNLSQYEIGALTTKVKNFWWDADGAHVASGKNGSEVTTNTISTYGYHALMGLTGISFNYDSVKVVDLNSTTPSLNFYQPPTISGSTVTQGKKTMQLSNNALTFYNPNDGTTAAALDGNGLVVQKGGIIAGNYTTNPTKFIYLSTEDYSGSPTITINGNSTGWRQVIGTKFGVKNDGTLYASNAVISGTITIGAGSNVYTKTEADNAFDASGDAAAAQAAAIAAAATDATNKANAAQENAIAEIPTNISELTNDSGYQNASQVSGAVSTGISNASVSDLSDGSNYYTSTQTQDYITGLGYQTESEVSGAINTVTSNLATKSDATYRTQRIYRRYTSAQSNLSGPTTWVSTNTDIYTDWTTKIPPLTNGSTKYLYLYTCVQKQTVTQYNNGSGTNCTCTEVLLDDTTTVINGGSVIAGSITANEITGSKLSAIYADMGNITAGNITKGNNSINFDNSPATLEFKNASTWTSTTQGIKYDSDGLAIKGAITASSLTINSGASITDNTGLISNDAIEIGGRNLLLQSNQIGSNSNKIFGWQSNGSSTTLEKTVYDGLECLHFYGSVTGTSIPTIVSAQRIFLENGYEYTISCDLLCDKETKVQSGSSPIHYHNGKAASTTNPFDLTNVNAGGGFSFKSISPTANTVIPANTWQHYEQHITTPATPADANYPYSTYRAFVYGTYVRTVSEDATVNMYMRDWKVEKGNKATNWTPAPEDLTISENLLGATANPTVPTNSNSSASSGFGTIGRYNSPASEFSLENYDGYANTMIITSSATGNRGVSWYTKAGEIKAGETYTFSCKVKSSVSVAIHTHTAWRNGSATAGYTGWTSEGSKTISANTWTDYSYTFTPSSSAQLDWEFLVALCFTGATTGVTCRIAHAKLEKGTRVTSWSEAEGDGAFTAKNYITKIDNGGIKVHDAGDIANYSQINSNGMQVYQNNEEVASFGASSRIGREDSGNLLATSNGIAIKDGLIELATFGADGAQVGSSDGGSSYFTIQKQSIGGYNYRNTPYFEVGDISNTEFTLTYETEAGYVTYGTQSLLEAATVTKVTVDGIQVSGWSRATQYSMPYRGLNYNSSTSGNELIIYYKFTSIAPYFSYNNRKSGETIGRGSFSIGYNCIASNEYATAEGYQTEASGLYSHAEGRYTHATDSDSHAEGYLTIANGSHSHAEGEETEARGAYGAHAEGDNTLAWGTTSHAGGYNTVANFNYQTVVGKFNKFADSYTRDSNGRISSITINDKYYYPFSVGWGDDEDNRKNIFGVTRTGDIEIYLDVDANASSSVAATSGNDMELFNIIRTLGWYSNVIV